MSASAQTVPLSAANLHVMTKQHLVVRDGKSAELVSNDLCGLHATSEVTPYLSLWNRISDFSPDVLVRSLYVTKKLVRIRAMRGTFFLVSRDMLPMVAAATAVSGESIGRSLARWGIPKEEFHQLSDAVIRVLSDRMKTASEIKRAVPKHLIRNLTLKQGRRILRRTNVAEVLNLLVISRKLLSQTEPLPWQALNWDGYGERTFGPVVVVRYCANPHEGETGAYMDSKVELARLYIKSYGPVTADDVAWWMDESKPVVSRLLDSLSNEIAKITIEGLNQDFFVHGQDSDLLEASQRNAIVRFLPYEDPYLKGFKVRDRLVPPNLEKRIYPMGNVVPSVVLDGRIVGSWSVAQEPRLIHVRVRPLVRVPSKAEPVIRKEGRGLMEFLAGGRSLRYRLSFAR